MPIEPAEHPSMNTIPSISVVLTIGSLRKVSTLALRALLEQDIIDLMEILIFDCSPAGTPALPGSDHPSVRVTKPQEDITFDAAVLIGIREARAPIVALLEEHCIVLPKWARALVEAHKEPWGAVCGAVINGNPGLGMSNAEFLATRNIRWQSPAERCQLSMIDGDNSAYKRDILLNYGDQLGPMLRAEAVLLLKMQEDGYKLLLEPAARYIHIGEASFHTLPSTLFYWHRVFGYSRTLVFHWSALQRLRRLIMLPLLPWLQNTVTLSYILKKRRDQLWMFIKNLPLLLVLQYCSNAGQAVGIVFGDGNAADLFSERERGVERIPKIDLNQQKREKSSI
jgi:Glycosyl transferase family 2